MTKDEWQEYMKNIPGLSDISAAEWANYIRSNGFDHEITQYDWWKLLWGNSGKLDIQISPYILNPSASVGNAGVQVLLPTTDEEYQGYFKIEYACELAPPGSPNAWIPKIAVVDGGGSKVNIAYINGYRYTVPNYKSSEIDVTQYIYLRYIRALDRCDIFLDPNELNSDSDYGYYRLGAAVVTTTPTTKTMTFRQEFLGGLPHLCHDPGYSGYFTLVNINEFTEKNKGEKEDTPEEQPVLKFSVIDGNGGEESIIYLNSKRYTVPNFVSEEINEDQIVYLRYNGNQDQCDIFYSKEQVKDTPSYLHFQLGEVKIKEVEIEKRAEKNGGKEMEKVKIKTLCIKQDFHSGLAYLGSGGGTTNLGVLTSGPPNGYGPASWQQITVNSNGTWTVTGDEVPVTVPLLK